ncbi:MAG TPA: hypothetical protein VK442_07230 [Xanthobacteraceae bacterium]|nr:hypothetical protein [Xanthobacteraceae bacterium]
MKIIVMTVVAVVAGAWVTMPAQAQQQPNAPPGHSLPGMEKPPKEEEHHTVKADEKAYKSALDGIQTKQSFDPWGNVRKKPKSSGSR